MRILARFIIIAALLVVLLAMLNLLAGRILAAQIDDALQKQVQTTQGVALSYSSLNLNLARALLTFHDFQISDSVMQAKASSVQIGLSYSDVFRLLLKNPDQGLQHIDRLKIQTGSLEFIMPETIAGQLYIERLLARGSVDFAPPHQTRVPHSYPALDAGSTITSSVHKVTLNLQMESLLWTPPAALADTYGLLFTLFELPETELPVRRVSVPLHLENDTLRVTGGTMSSVAFDAEWDTELVARSGGGWEPSQAAVTLVRLSEETEHFVTALEQFFQISLPRKNGLLYLEISDGSSNLSLLPGTVVSPF